MGLFEISEPNSWFVIIFRISTLSVSILEDFGVSFWGLLQEIPEPLEIWKYLGESLTLELQNLG